MCCKLTIVDPRLEVVGEKIRLGMLSKWLAHGWDIFNYKKWIEMAFFFPIWELFLLIKLRVNPGQNKRTEEFDLVDFTEKIPPTFRWMLH